jgi:hypothetical protein
MNANGESSMLLGSGRHARALGIAALLLAALSMSVSHSGNIVAIWVAMACGAVAALGGRRAFPVAALATAGIGLLLFSPFTMAAIAGHARAGRWLLPFAAIVPFCFPIVAMIVSAKRVRSRRASTT